MWAPAITTTEPPPAEPVSLDEAKGFVVVETDADDVLLGMLIAGARKHVEDVTGTRLAVQTLELHADSFADLARLPTGPITAVSKVVYDDVTGVEQTIDAADYELFGAGLDRGIRPAFGKTWPVGALRVGAVRVTATAGYANLPVPLKLAMLLVIGDFYANRETVSVGQSAQAIPTSVRLDDMLANYRIWL